MILSYFKKPRWQHRDPKVRRTAVESGRLEQELLIRIARDDQDIEVRCAACRRIGHLQTLLATLGDQDPRLSAAARSRLLALLCGNEAAEQTLEERLQQVEIIDDRELLFQVAQQGKEALLRGAALGRLTDPSQILAVALADPVSSNRVSAVEMLDDRDLLNEVIQRVGKKDKNVYRLARSRLRDIGEREAMPEIVRARCESLCGRLERLGQHGNWVEDRATLSHIEQQWAEPGMQPDSQWQNRYESLRTRFLERYADYCRDNRERVEEEQRRSSLRSARQTLIDRLRDGSHDLGAEALEAHIEACEGEWAKLDDQGGPKQQELQRVFSHLKQEVRGHLSQLIRTDRASSELTGELQRLEGLLEGQEPLDRKAEERALEVCHALLQELSAAPHLRERLQELQEAFEQRLLEQQNRARSRMEQIPAELDALADCLDRGELKRAEGLSSRIRSHLELIGKSGISGGSSLAPLERRFHDLTGTIQELRKWRKWGTDQQREQLCREMEELLQNDGPPESMADRLRQMQQQWKRLDRSGPRVNRALWDRFHQAAEQVYEHCRPFLEEQAEAQRHNRSEKQALCEQIETFLGSADWEHIDWKKAVQATRETRSAWRRIGAVEKRHHGPLERRFRNGLKKVEARFAREREQNLAFRKALIDRMKLLLENPEIDDSIEQAKQLQQQWHTTVTASRAEENRLWGEFRGAADQVFERRQTRSQAQQRQLEANLETRRSLCRQLLALAESGEPDIQVLESGQRALQRQWQENRGLEVPAKTARSLENEWRSAESSLQHRIRQLRTELARRNIDNLRLHAALCRQLEETPDRADPAELAAVEEAWAQAPELENTGEREVMEERFRLAREIFLGTVRDKEALGAAQQENLQRRLKLCLYLEIIAGIESPPEVAEERMQFQVARLSGRMSDGDDDTLDQTDTPELEKRWHLMGSVPAGRAQPLEERFHSIEAALGARD